LNRTPGVLDSGVGESASQPWANDAFGSSFKPALDCGGRGWNAAPSPIFALNGRIILTIIE